MRSFSRVILVTKNSPPNGSFDSASRHVLFATPKRRHSLARHKTFDNGRRISRVATTVIVVPTTIVVKQSQKRLVKQYQ
jgi:hypothetical protein